MGVCRLTGMRRWLRGVVFVISLCVFVQFVAFFFKAQDPDSTNAQLVDHRQQKRGALSHVPNMIYNIGKEVHLESDDAELDEESAERGDDDTRLHPPPDSPPPSPRVTEVNLKNSTSGYNITMITDMASTNELWPWPETVQLVEACVHEPALGSLGTLPTVAVVITFHQEETLAHLLHTIHSVTQRSPAVLLRQIVLVNDGSTKAEYREILPTYVKAVFTEVDIKILTNRSPKGLVKSRLAGIRSTSADIIVILDSHMEVQAGWLEPLVREILLDRRTLASSYIDWMTPDKSGWEYKHGGSTWKTVFDWAFLFSFQDISDTDKANRKLTEPIRSPVMVGGAWAMATRYFEEVGTLDPGMQFWGGENIDLSLRVWLMGGRVVNVPCSHVGHYESPTSRAYRSGKEAMIHLNYKRVVDVWMDDYARLFYRAFPQLKNTTAGDLGMRQLLKDKVKYNFTWYLKNVFPELGVPDTDSYAWGRLVHTASGLCLTSRYMATPTLLPCGTTREADQGVYWSMKGELRYAMNVFVATYDNALKHHSITLREATSLYGEQLPSRWLHWQKGPLIDTKKKRCLTTRQKTDTWDIQLDTCVHLAANQTWSFTSYAGTYVNMIEVPSDAAQGAIRAEIKHYRDLLQRTGRASEQRPVVVAQ